MEVGFELRKALGMQDLLDRMEPASPYGAERVRKPVFFGPSEQETLERTHRNVAVALQGLGEQRAAYDRLDLLLMQMRDIRGTLQRARETVLTEVELFEIKRYLLQLSQLVGLYAQIGDEYEGIAFTEETEALTLLDPGGHRSAGFSIGAAFTKALADIHARKHQVEKALRAASGQAEQEALQAERRQIVVQEEQETLRVRQRLTEGLAPYIDALMRNTQAIGELDYTVQKAKLARRLQAVMPVIAQGDAYVEDMDNPPLGDALAQRGASFTRLTMELPAGVTVITGANMGGKSVAIRTLALNVLLCQAGFFVCAGAARLPLFDEICVIGGDLEDAQAGLSSFGAEVVHIQRVLERIQAGAFCLVAMDEPARGTNPHEGAALVGALIGCLSQMQSISVVATHYDGVADQAQAHYQAAGLRDLPEMAGAQDRLAFIARHMNYGLVRVGTDAAAPKEALTVCRLLGLDAEVVADMEGRLAKA